MDTLGTLAVKYDKACKKIDDLKTRLYDCNDELKSKKQKIENRENKIDKLKKLCLEKDEMIRNLNDEINKLKDKIDYLNAISNHDSTMVGFLLHPLQLEKQNIIQASILESQPIEKTEVSLDIIKVNSVFLTI